MNPLLIVFILIALIFDFLNGFHDSANVVATAIASRALPPKYALAIAALADLSGPFLFGVAVATTIGDEVLAKNAVTIPVAMAALLSAITWNILTWWFGIPSSSSHALIGGFVGSAIMGFGFGVIRMEGMYKVLIGLFISPIIGLIIGWIIMKITLMIGRATSPKINTFFRGSQWLTMITLGLSHGSNDAQKTMGVVTMGLVAFGVIPTFHVPPWVIIICALSISLGMALGGWRLIKTMGGKFYRIRPVHAFSSQFASTTVILGSALLGAPVSTTQVISSTILGAGSAERIQKVRWGIAGQIVLAWIFTIPATGALGALFYLLLSPIL